ncbi:unnamed protein product, partial [Didymodactylos carnosus]
IFKANGRIDAGLRKHLGNSHKLVEYLYPSQKKQRPKVQPITPERKRDLDE